MRPRVVEGEVCQCGRDIVMLGGYPNILVCRGCSFDKPFCTCASVGLVSPEVVLERMLEDKRRGDW